MEMDWNMFIADVIFFSITGMLFGLWQESWSAGFFILTVLLSIRKIKST